MSSPVCQNQDVWITERPSRSFQFSVMLIIATWIAICIAYIVVLGRTANDNSPSGFAISILNVTIANWLLWVGGSLGGYWYLVDIRIRGGNSTGGRSKCPRCGTTIHFSDIFPVLGWLRLDGCCRACKLSISTSYPIAELTFAVFALMVGMMQIARRCFNTEGSFEMLSAVWILQVRSIDVAIFASSIFVFAIGLTLVRGALIRRTNGRL